MIRFYRDFVAQLILLTAYLKFIAGNPSMETMKEALGRVDVESIDPDLRDPLAASQNYLDQVEALRIGYHPEEPAPTLDTAFRHLVEHQDAKPDDLSLIDTLVDILQMPFSGNFLNLKVVKAIRKAILTSSELESLKAMSEKRELSCKDCGHRFVNGEAVTLSRTGHGDVQLFCVKCVTPLYLPCSSCEGGICGINSGMRSHFVKLNTCSECKVKKSEEHRAAAGVNAVRDRIEFRIAGDARARAVRPQVAQAVDVANQFRGAAQAIQAGVAFDIEAGRHLDNPFDLLDLPPNQPNGGQ